MMTFKKILAEAILIALVGALLAFAANALSPRGLALTRNYFPGGTNGLVSAPPMPEASRTVVAGNTNPVSAEQLLAAQLNEKGLEPIGRNRALQLFRDPRLQQQLIVFVDARNDDHYRQGHIPGAYQLDPYHPENYLPAVLPACQAADEVIVYCTGGECEDSQFAAILLRDAGIPGRKLRIYAAGITDWTTNHLPVELGGRNSGRIENAGR